MDQAVQGYGGHQDEIPDVCPPRRLSLPRFLLRYPLFLLAFGPPIFRSGSIDATKGLVDVWSFLQVGLLVAISFRAIYRLTFARSVLIPRPVRSILKLAFILGLVFLSSSVYSPSRFVSAAYCALYFLTLICVLEFVADVYKDPPDWIQCLFHLRVIALVLLVIVLITLYFAPSLVLTYEAGIRLRGGAVAPMDLIGPAIAVISGFSLLYACESRTRSALFFCIGLAATLISRSRGAEIALLLSLSILALGWAKTGRRSALIFLSGLMASIFFSGFAVAKLGAGRVWNLLNRGESAEGIATASGRTQIWKFVLDYCASHPQGMGYIAGFRILFRRYFTLGLLVDVNDIGNSHNSFIDVLADAGWLALAIYLVMLVKIIYAGWRFANPSPLRISMSSAQPNHAVRCALILLVLCLADGMSSAEFTVPLRTVFYWQNIIVAIILGISARLIAVSRAQHAGSTW